VVDNLISNERMRFEIGDEVEIIGQPCGSPGYWLSGTGMGKVTDAILANNNFKVNGWWYPASSLRLVEPDKATNGKTSLSCVCPTGRLDLVNRESELKIGDYVEIVRPDIDDTGKIRMVIQVDNRPSMFHIKLDDKAWWRVSSLRKLTPSEIEEHLKPELKIGDWVQVEAPDYTENGRIFQIKHIVHEESGDFFSYRFGGKC